MTTTITHPDNFDKFIEWFKNDFHKRNGGYHPTRINLWWERSESAHQNIRKFIGGIRREKRIVLKAHQNPASAESVANEVAVIKEILPNYLVDYNYDESVFLRPTIDSGTHNVLKTAKHIRQYAEQRLDMYYPENKEKMARLDKALSTMGSAWARARVSDSELDITLTTSPRGFVLLGHYGPDHDSCFRQGSDKTEHKWIFGQTENTFVITISKYDGKRHKNIVRCMGFANKDFTVFNLANCYFLQGAPEGDSLEAIKLFLEDMWDEKATLVEGKVYIPRDIVYHNPYGNWSFVKGNKTAISSQELNPNINNIRLFVCPKCAAEDSGDKNWEEVDSDYICRRCHSTAFVCEITKKKTFKELIPVVSSDGSIIMVCEEASQEFIKCQDCQTLAQLNFETAYGREICCNCIEANYTCCDNCQEYVEDKNVINSEDEDTCKDCIDLGINPFDDEIINFIDEMTAQEAGEINA